MRKEEKHTIRTTVAKPVVIALPVNQTTGFSWEIDSCDPALTCQQLPYARHLGGLGAGGTQKFEIDAPQAGEFVVRLRLKRPWETTVREVRTYHIVVTKGG